jgi:hypothetical protein
MKWLLVISFLGGHMGGDDYERILFATEEECMAAAEDIVEANPSFEWLDDPSGSKGWTVIRSTVECVGAGEGPED